MMETVDCLIVTGQNMNPLCGIWTRLVSSRADPDGQNPIPTKRRASVFALRATLPSNGRMFLFSTDLSWTCHAPVAKIPLYA